MSVAAIARRESATTVITNQFILLTQLASVLGFVIAAFALYRLLVHQKEATIRLQEEQISLLKEKLAFAESQTPDELALALSNRIKLYEKELIRVTADKSATEDELNEKKIMLRDAKNEAEQLATELVHATEHLSDFLCPGCGAPLSRREFSYETVEHGERQVDIDHDYKLFECGLELIDGMEHGRCGNTR